MGSFSASCFLFAMIAGCGSGGGEGDRTDDLQVLERFEFQIDPGALPGSELYQCRSFDIGRARGAALHALHWVPPSSAIQLHHAMMFATADSASSGPVACDPMPAPVAVLPLYAPGNETLRFPSGVSIAIPESATAIFVELHLLRVGEGSASASVELQSTATPPDHLAGWVDDIAPVPTIAARSSATSTGTCRFQSTAQLVASWPHMHALGTRFQGSVVRADGHRESFLDLAWDFQHQDLHPVDIALAPGDAVETQCNWANTSDSPVTGGSFSKDEMCNQGLVVWPREAAHCEL